MALTFESAEEIVYMWSFNWNDHAIYKMVLTIQSIHQLLTSFSMLRAQRTSFDLPSFDRCKHNWFIYFWTRLWEMKRGLFIFRLTWENIKSVDEILKCDHSNESYWAVLSCGAVYYAIQGGSNFWLCVWNPKVWPFKWKLLSSTFLWCCLLCYTRWF